MMGLGRILTRYQSRAVEQHTRAITEFAIVDGVAVDGSGESGNRYRGAMSIPGAWRASVLLSDLLGEVPWHAYRQFAGRPVELLDPTPPLLEQPHWPDTRMTTFSSWGLDLIYHGNALGVIAARNALGWPTAAVPVPAEQVGVRRITKPGMSSVLPVGSIEYAIGAMRLGSQDMIHIKGPCQPSALRGMGVLEAHLEGALALAREQIRQAQSLSQHGVPTGVLKVTNPDATTQSLKDAKAGWLASQRDRTVAVLNATTEFEALSWNPEEMQLVEARRYSLTDMELIFGLPVGWLGGMSSARQYSNIEQDAINLLKFSLGGHLARFEQTLSLAFPRGTQAKANLDAILRPDTLARYQAHQIGITAGFLLDDEARELENRPPLTAAQRERLKPTPPPPPDDQNTEKEEELRERSEEAPAT